MEATGARRPPPDVPHPRHPEQSRSPASPQKQDRAHELGAIMSDRIERVAEVIRDFWPHRMSLAAAQAIEGLYAQETIDAAHLANQRAWSTETFGPGTRLHGVLDHIRKELVEIEESPADVSEWVDVIILAFDGAWRAGWEPQQIIDAIKAKQAKNEGREWPDWRTMSADAAIEHVRTEAAS